MRLIGLTGGIATGKSRSTAMLGGRGATVIDSDALAREAVLPGEPTLERVIERFGTGVLLPDGNLDRSGSAGSSSPTRQLGMTWNALRIRASSS